MFSALRKRLAALVLALGFGLYGSSVSALQYSRHDNDSPTLNAILASGEVVAGDADRLVSILRQLPKKKNTAIYLASPGGDIYEGIRLGLLFAKNRLKTVVEGGQTCASACAIAFLGGRDSNGNRWMSTTTTSQLGFHAFRKADGSMVMDSDHAQRVVADILDYGARVGAPREIMVKMFRTQAGSMYWIPPNEALALGIKVWDINGNCFLPCR